MPLQKQMIQEERLDTVANTIIKAAGFIDLRKPQLDLHENEYLHVEDQRITGFVAKDNIPANCEVLDFSSLFAFPGLVDASFLPQMMWAEDGSSPDNYGQHVWVATPSIIQLAQLGHNHCRNPRRFRRNG